MTELVGEETHSVTKVAERAKPTLVTVGKRQIISDGRWNDELMADFVAANAKDKYLEIGKLAAVLGANSIPNKKRVRAKLSRLFLAFLKREQVLAVEYNGKHNAASAVKVADISSKTDWDLVKRKLDRMKSSKELTETQYCAAVCVIGAAKIHA